MKNKQFLAAMDNEYLTKVLVHLGGSS